MEKKKDLRVQKTYSALMAAFEALMAEETFDDITVNELCARALIRRRDRFAGRAFSALVARAHRLYRRAPGAHPHGPAQQVAADHF